MGEYHDLYLLSDVLLLTDVLVKFRALCLDNYQLDPWHFHTLPGKLIYFSLDFSMWITFLHYNNNS